MTPNAGVAASLLADALLCLVFFIQHSTMVRRGFRLWLIRTVRAEFHGALYASLSGMCLLILVLFWQPVGSILWAPSAGTRWAMAGILLLVAAGAWWSTHALGEFDALGIKPARSAFGRPGPEPPVELIIRGPIAGCAIPCIF